MPVNRIRHKDHIEFVKDNVDHVAWIRSVDFEFPYEIYTREKEGLGSGLVDLVVSIGGIDAPGNSPMLGVGVRFIDHGDSERDTIEGTAYYYAAVEVGSKLSDKSLQYNKYFNEEEVIEPPKWLDLPFTESSDEQEAKVAKNDRTQIQRDAEKQGTRHKGA